MVFSLQTVSRPVISLQTVKPTSVYNMPQDPGQPLLKNTRKHFVETFFSHLFFYNVPFFFASGGRGHIVESSFPFIYGLRTYIEEGAFFLKASLCGLPCWFLTPANRHYKLKAPRYLKTQSAAAPGVPKSLVTLVLLVLLNWVVRLVLLVLLNAVGPVGSVGSVERCWSCWSCWFC